MVPFVERNYNLVELGPRGTGKSHLFSKSRLTHISFRRQGYRGAHVRQQQHRSARPSCVSTTWCLRRISGVAFDKGARQHHEGYMESGEFSRGRGSIRASGSLVFVGNFEGTSNINSASAILLALPTEMRNDTAFMDRIHAYIPVWMCPRWKRAIHKHFGR